MKQFRYTDEMKQFIYDNNHLTPAKQLAEMFNARFGTDRTAQNMKTFRHNHKLNSGLTGRYGKGHVSANKGKKWDEFLSKGAQENCRKTCFKKGHIPYNRKPVGYERLTRDGFIEVKVSDIHHGDGLWYKDWKLKQRLIWEEAHGPIPEKHMIIFLDGDKSNFDIDNLACVSMSENARLNQRKMRFQGEPELTEACVNLVKLDNMQRSYFKKKSGHDGKESKC